MKYRKLGNTGLEVSEIGFGTWGIGGVSDGAISYGPTDDRESTIALWRAFELGVNFFDTSDLYGYGHSESLIGEVFKDVRGKLLIASKVGFVKAYGRQDFSPKHIRKSIEGSLRRLQTDYIDLYQLHSPPVELLEKGGIVDSFHSLKKEGKVRAIGISVRSPDDGLRAVEGFGFESIQVNFNMVDQRALETGLMDVCRKTGVGLICRTPLCYGFLTGKFSPTSRFDSQDHRSRWPSEQIALWANAYRLFSSALEYQNQTHGQIALKFCLSYPSVSTVIPGMLNKCEVEENVSASDLGALTDTERLKVEKIYRDNAFFAGKKITTT